MPGQTLTVASILKPWISSFINLLQEYSNSIPVDADEPVTMEFVEEHKIDNMSVQAKSMLRQTEKQP